MLKISNNLYERVKNLVAESYKLFNLFLSRDFHEINCNEMFECNFVKKKKKELSIIVNCDKRSTSLKL